jgi:plasmid stabilization system protein ParE
VKELRWTNEAIAALASLGNRTRQALLDTFDLVVEFPEMYPVRQRGKFAGLRYFALRKRWIVYYRTKNDEVLVLAIVPARARPL